MNLKKSIFAIVVVILLSSCSNANNTVSINTTNDVSIDTIEFLNEEISLNEETMLTSIIKIEDCIDYPFIPNSEMNFEDNDLADLLKRGTYASYWLLDSCDGDVLGNTDVKKINGTNMTKSIFTYDDFYDYLCSIFTNDYVDSQLKYEYSPYENVDGYLYYLSGGGRGSDPSFDKIIFEIYEKSDTKIIIKGTARYCHSDFPDVERFEEYYYSVILTENGWRFDNFELWN